MLRKLIKHELRATGRVMLPLLALELVAAVGGNISTYRLLETSNGVLNTLGIVLLFVGTDCKICLHFCSRFLCCLYLFPQILNLHGRSLHLPILFLQSGICLF